MQEPISHSNAEAHASNQASGSNAALPVHQAAGHAEVKGEPENLGALLFKPDPGLAIWTLVVFFVLLLLLWRFAWKPILKVLSDREELIHSSLEKAEQARKAAADMEETRAKMLEDSQKQAAEMVSKARAEAQSLAAQVQATAREEARKLLETARADIQREKATALRDLREETARLAFEVARKVIAEQVDEDLQRRLVEKHLGEISSTR